MPSYSHWPLLIRLETRLSPAIRCILVVLCPYFFNLKKNIFSPIHAFLNTPFLESADAVYQTKQPKAPLMRIQLLFN